jgi:hypothetical protein
MSLACVACSRPGAAWRRLSGGDEFHAVCSSQHCLAQLIGGAHDAKRQQLEIDLTGDIDGNDDDADDDDSDAATRALMDVIAGNTAANVTLAALDQCTDARALELVARHVPLDQWVLLYGTTAWFRRALDTPDTRAALMTPGPELSRVAVSAENTGLYELADHIYQLSVPALAQRGADYFRGHSFEAIQTAAMRSSTESANLMLRLAIASGQHAAVIAAILAARTAHPMRAEPRPSPFDAAVRAGRVDIVPEFIEYNRQLPPEYERPPDSADPDVMWRAPGDWVRWKELARLARRHAMEWLIARYAAEEAAV